MSTWSGGNISSVIVAALLSLLFPLIYGEQAGLLESLPADILETLVKNEPLLYGAASKDDDSKSGFKSIQDSLTDPLKILKQPKSTGVEIEEPFGQPSHHVPLLKPIPGTGKLLKAKALPLKKVAVKKAVGAKILVPKVKKVQALKVKPKVYALKPIVHVIEKPVPVFHKVPVPKKVMIPKFYPVKKAIPVPKIIPVPFKVPVKKIIPKIVKIPKPIPVPKFVAVKKPIPLGIPYPVPKFYKVPVPKPVPYAKYIPIPIKKKVPKFIPVPVKKIIKVPKPYYVPIKVPYITTSYMKTPMVVKVPDIKKSHKFVPKPVKFFPKPTKGFGDKLDFIEPESEEIYKVKDSDTVKTNHY
ncbi:UNVERIFIED_CONTAM: Magel2 [Trichonephila clavipes]